MLNLYLATRGSGGVDEAAEAALVAFLKAEGLIGEAEGADAREFPPGPEVQWLFSEEAHEALLPAELTFDALRVERSERLRFLPEATAAFEAAKCTVCGDGLDADQLEDALARLSVFPVERFSLGCPSCQTDLGLKDIDFGQPTAVSGFWIYIEGAGTARLAPRIVERLAKVLGQALVLVPEVVDSQREAWVPPPSRRGGRRRR